MRTDRTPPWTAKIGGSNLARRHERIASPQNERLRGWIRLQKDGRARREAGSFVLEGRRLVETALGLGKAKTLLYCRHFAGDWLESLVDEAERQGLEIIELTSAAFRKLADVPSPQGAAALADVPHSEPADVFRDGALVLAACGVQEPGNLGAMVRSACAAGATGFAAVRPSADITHPRAVRASAGAVLALAALRLAEEEFLDHVRGAGFTVYGAVPPQVESGGEPFRKTRFDRPCVIAVGSEARGLPERIASVSRPVTIPMRGGIESLNAAAAAALLIFEAASREQ